MESNDLEVKCPRCDTSFHVEDASSGTVHCPHCAAPVAISSSKSVAPVPSALLGMNSATATAATAALMERVSQATGLEKLEGFSVRSFFSEVFRKHEDFEIEDYFKHGAYTTTPPLQDVLAAWPAPWAFFRVLVFCLLATVGFYWAFQRFGNPIFVPGWIFIGCFGIPLATMILFLETNVLRNISLYRILTLALLGGLLSIIMSLFLYEITGLATGFGAMSAGLFEEAGKLLAVIYLARKWVGRFPWILNGMVFGAAVGTGFSAFESAGYVFVAILADEGESVMMLRGFVAPLTHTIWTAAAAGALWRIQGATPFSWNMLGDWRFLRIFLIVAVLHALWNSPIIFPLLGEIAGWFAFRLILGAAGWIVVLLLLQSGIKQVAAAKRVLKDGGGS